MTDISGKLIVIEGACDGIGKSTQYQKLIEHLESDGISVTCHHFPSYGTYQGALVEKYLAGEIGSKTDLSPYFINTLFAIDRGITWFTELKNSYEAGNTIVLDRYTTSSLIYQAALIEDVEDKKRFLDYITDYEYHKIGIKEPDNVIFLYAPFDLVTKMRQSRQQNDGIANDIHERDQEYMKKVYENALFVANYLGWDIIKCNDGDKMRTPEEIHQDIYQLISKQRGETRK